MSNKNKIVKADKATARGLIPELRFPEFRDAGKWGAKKLGKVAIFFKGKGLPKSVITPNGKSPCIHYGELFTEYPEVIEIVKSRTNSEENVFLSIENDVLMPTSDVTPNGLAKACCVKLNDVILGGDILVIRTKKKEINGEFLARHIRYLEQKVLQLVSGSTVFHLYATSIDKLDLSFPSRYEQQKIADCLSSLDELITAQAQKLDTLKAHKKGLMQQLFPAKGETIPKLRFPEFRDAGAWEEKALNQVADYENGKAHEQDIAESGEFIVANSKFISTEGEVKKFTNIASCIAEKEDILMVLSDVPNGRAIAKCFFVDSDNLYTVNQRICKIVSKKVVSIMLFYVLNRNPYFLAFDDGVKQTNLKKDDVLNCPILLPKGRKEQQKIADCLSSLDELITAHAQKLDTLKAHKKGLMQQLFPSTDEVNE